MAKIDLIIPTYKPDSSFDTLLRRMAKQTVSLNRIIIMNTEEDFFHSEAVKEFPNVEVVHIKQKEFDHGGTRHQGAMMSDAEFVLFMTQDAMPKDSKLVEHLLGAMEDSKVSVAYARQVADPKKSPMEAFIRTFNYPKESRVKSYEDLENLGIKTFFCSDVCALYRKSSYVSLGGFPLRTIFNEDMIMASKMIEAHEKVAYVAEAVVLHYHDYTAKQQLKRNFDLAVSQQMYGGLFLKVSSESEGIKMVLKTAGFLVKTGRIHLLPKLVIQSGAKFIGYKLGRNYERLSQKQIKKLTSSPSFWESK